MRIDWSNQAVEDLEAIHAYIARDAERFAARFVARVIDAVGSLAEFPRLGRHVPEVPEQPDIRELLFQSYRIIYRLEDEQILVLTVLHGSRDLSRLEPPAWEIT